MVAVRASTEVREDRGVWIQDEVDQRRIQGWLAGSFRSPTGARLSGAEGDAGCTLSSLWLGVTEGVV